MIIEKATFEDLKTIAIIEKNCFNITPWSYDDYVQDFNTNPFSNFYVAKQENIILGFIDYWITFEQGQIAKIAVLSPVRNKGIGKALLLNSMKDMIEKGVTSITLEVRSSNISAIKLYESCDFKKASIRKNYYSDGEDALLMMWGEL